MPVTIKNAAIKYKDPATGEYKTVDAISDGTTAERVAAIEAAANAADAAMTAKAAQTIASIPGDYTELSNEVDELKNDLPHKVDQRAVPYGYMSWIYDPSIWQGGGIIQDNGENNSPTSTIGKARIRTTTFVTGIDRILRIDGGTYVYIYKYNLDGTYNSYEGSFSDFSSFDYENYKYRIALERVSGDTIANTLPKYAMLADASDFATKEETEAIASGLGASIDEVSDVIALINPCPVPFTIKDVGYGIRFSTGELVSNSSISATDYIDIKNLGEYLQYKQIRTTVTIPVYGMAFYDKDKQYISGVRVIASSDQYGYSSYLRTVKVPSNAVYARFSVINDTDTYGSFELYAKTPLAAKAAETGDNSKILALSDSIAIPYSIEEYEKGIRYSTGVAETFAPTATTNYIDISKYASISYKRLNFDYGSVYGMAFYDKDKQYISGQRANTSASTVGYEDELKTISAPANAVYARFSVRSDEATYGSFLAYGTSKLYKAIGEYSDFQKDIYWWHYSSEWYKAQGDSYEGFTGNTLYSEMITAWDALVSNSNGYITKDTIGTSSDEQTMYCYKLIPAVYRNGTGTGSPSSKAPIILIVPSQHGFEKSAAFGTYYFARDLVYNYDKNPVLNSIRTKCILYIVPVANPYGFDNKTRKNANGVDLNRNWGTPDGSSGGGSTDPDSPYYAGEEPFDQPETQAIKAIIDATPNMFYVIDYHTNGQYRASSWANVNWISYPHQVVEDMYFNNAYIAGYFQCSDLSENLPIEYNLVTNGATIGSMTLGAASSTPGVGGVTIGAYARTQNIMGQTFEGNNGLPSEESSYSAMEQKINSELIGNWVKNLLLAFSKII